MELKARKTYSLIEIKVDEIETTLFKSDLSQIESMIRNLLDVADDLASYTDKQLIDYLTEV